jgi:hypothetical protein
MKSGDIFFVMNHGNIVSKTIAGAMDSKWSHSGIIYEVGQLETYTLETNDWCVMHGSFDHYLNGNYSFEVYRPKSTSAHALQATADQMHGRVYPYWQLISFGIRRLFRMIGINIRNFWRGGQVCCGIVINYLKRTEITCVQPIQPEDIDTEELYQLVLKSNEFELVLKKNAI